MHPIEGCLLVDIDSLQLDESAQILEIAGLNP
jgi:hypothetical protein